MGGEDDELKYMGENANLGVLETRAHCKDKEQLTQESPSNVVVSLVMVVITWGLSRLHLGIAEQNHQTSNRHVDGSLVSSSR